MNTTAGSGDGAFPRGKWPAALILFFLLAASFLAAVSLGETAVSPARALLSPGSQDAAIFFGIRLPRALLAVLTGASLAFSGAALQALLQNPLADPFILGVSGGAALGATLSLALGVSALSALAGTPCAILPDAFSGACTDGASSLAVVTSALLGAALATLAVFRVSTHRGALSPIRALLAGVVFNALASAAVTFVKALTSPDRLGEVTLWLSGQIPLVSPGTVALIAAAELLAFFRILGLSHALNLLGMGERGALLLGLDVPKARRALFFWISLAVASAVAFTGMIGFVGLIAPHLVRRTIGGDSRFVIPFSALLGASCLLLADLAARLLLPLIGTTPPVGALTALFGAPLFLSVLKKSGGGR